MNRLKSIFITLFITLLIVGFVYNLYQFFNNNSDVRLLGATLVCLIPLGYFIFLYLKKPSKVGHITMVVTAASGSAFLITLGKTLFNGVSFDLVLGFSLTALVGWLLYLSWYSKFNNRNIQRVVGTKFEGSHLCDSNGKKIELSINSNDFHIFLFHRGNWCPLCMAQVRDIANEYKLIDEMNVGVHIISPANENWTTKLVNKYKVSFDFLIDKDLKTAKRLGIYQEHGIPFGFQVLGFSTDTVLPTVVLTDKNYTILYIHETDDYKNRPEPAFFIRLIESFK